MRILLAEDEPDLGQALKRTLIQEAYVVDWVLSGDNALGAVVAGGCVWRAAAILLLELILAKRKEDVPRAITIRQAGPVRPNAIGDRKFATIQTGVL